MHTVGFLECFVQRLGILEIASLKLHTLFDIVLDLLPGNSTVLIHLGLQQQITFFCFSVGLPQTVIPLLTFLKRLFDHTHLLFKLISHFFLDRIQMLLINLGLVQQLSSEIILSHLCLLAEQCKTFTELHPFLDGCVVYLLHFDLVVASQCLDAFVCLLLSHLYSLCQLLHASIVILTFLGTSLWPLLVNLVRLSNKSFLLLF